MTMRVPLVKVDYLLFVSLNLGRGGEVAYVLKNSNCSIEMANGRDGVFR
jgi:hypothetical protein